MYLIVWQKNTENSSPISDSIAIEKLIIFWKIPNDYSFNTK